MSRVAFYCQGGFRPLLTGNPWPTLQRGKKAQKKSPGIGLEGLQLLSSWPINRFVIPDLWLRRPTLYPAELRARLTALILPRGTGERNGFGAFREEPPPDDFPVPANAGSGQWAR